MLSGKSKRRILQGYVGNITVDPRLEQIKFAVVGKYPLWSWFIGRQSSGMSSLGNKKRMNSVRLSVHGVVDFSGEV